MQPSAPTPVNHTTAWDQLMGMLLTPHPAIFRQTERAPEIVVDVLTECGEDRDAA